MIATLKIFINLKKQFNRNKDLNRSILNITVVIVVFIPAGFVCFN